MAKNTTNTKLPKFVLLSTFEGDIGIVSGKTARADARSYAAITHTVVYLRDPTTDRVVGKVRAPATTNC